MQWKLLLVCLVCGLQACSESVPEFHSTDNPLRLSDWNLFAVDSDEINTNGNTLVFQPRNTLFTDHAHKLRTMWIPDSQQIELVNNGFDYPVGTILSKTFYYPIGSSGEFLRSSDAGDLSELALDTHRLIETRLLVRRQAGWEAFPYVWNNEQTEAFLRVAGTSLPVSLYGETESQEFTYFVPNENQCSGCHTRVHPDGGLEPLGAVAHQLNHGAGAQPGQASLLAAIQERGWLETIPTLTGNSFLAG